MSEFEKTVVKELRELNRNLKELDANVKEGVSELGRVREMLKGVGYL